MASCYENEVVHWKGKLILFVHTFPSAIAEIYQGRKSKATIPKIHEISFFEQKSNVTLKLDSICVYPSRRIACLMAAMLEAIGCYLQSAEWRMNWCLL